MKPRGLPGACAVRRNCRDQGWTKNRGKTPRRGADPIVDRNPRGAPGVLKSCGVGRGCRKGRDAAGGTKAGGVAGAAEQRKEQNQRDQQGRDRARARRSASIGDRVRGRGFTNNVCETDAARGLEPRRAHRRWQIGNQVRSVVTTGARGRRRATRRTRGTRRMTRPGHGRRRHGNRSSDGTSEREARAARHRRRAGEPRQDCREGDRHCDRDRNAKGASHRCPLDSAQPGSEPSRDSKSLSGCFSPGSPAPGHSAATPCSLAT